MTMRIYTSSDASAPVLEGVVGGAYSSGWAAGSLLELLRQVLVVGYGSKTAAGWTLAFTGTSKGVFTQGAGCGFSMRVLDDGSLTAGAREASFYGGEVFTDVDTAAAIFPTAAQQSTGLKFRKSDTADSTVRPWICFADNKTFYLFSVPQYPSGTIYYAGMSFGNFHSFVSNDAYNCVAIGRVTSATSDTATNETLDLVMTGSFLVTKNVGHYVARGYAQAGASLQFPKWASMGVLTNNNGVSMGNVSTSNPFPNPSDSTLILTRVYVIDADTAPTGCIRGFLRGFYCPGQTGSTIPLGQTFAGTGNLSGRTFQLLGLRTGGSANGRFTMETSDTWDS
jgi:hypothetical protein